MVVFEQVFLLLSFVIAGFLMVKLNVVKNEQADILSRICVYIFLPGSIFKTFALNFNKQYVFDNFDIIICSTVILLILIVSMRFVAKLFAKTNYERYVYKYAMAIPNFGFVGYPLAESLMGATGLLNLMTFAIPVSVYAYTVGVGVLTKRGCNLKGLLNSSLICTFAGIIIGLCEIPIPDMMSNVFVSACACMGPVGMLMTGMVIARFDLKRFFGRMKIYPAIVIRLILIPLIVGLATKQFCDETVSQIAILFYLLPCGLNTVILPELVNEDCETGAGLSMISTVASLLTIPVLCYFFGIGQI